ncbi:MAG: nicotinate phosphoribosyltransferase [Candidatus Aminicenantes bacterium]|nr:nicotinate phosphoribosyltransferase [Candidatus Aminicenantes bacterium]
MGKRKKGCFSYRNFPYSALNTDLYELTMAAVYFEKGMNEKATFSLFIRNYPPRRGYFVAAGLNEAIDFLLNLSFSPDDLAYLESLKIFKSNFLSFLEKFKFKGDVRALPEGSLFFAHEPLLEVEAPLIEAQIVETALINILHFQVLIATKASRCYHAAQGRQLIDFSFRRTHSLQAGCHVARASYLAGFAGTSNVLAGRLYGLPVYGTMAHSFISSFEQEIEAFQAYAEIFPERTILLIDTYDPLAGARKAAQVGQEMALKGYNLAGVRLDSGEMASLSQRVRRILDKAGLNQTKILASGAFDEYKIKQLIEKGAAIDAFGVGTKMGVSADASYLDMAYKLVEYAGREVLKLSPGKATLAGGKQVWRFYDNKGRFRHDVLSLKDEFIPGGKPLLKLFLKAGQLQLPLATLEEIRNNFFLEFSKLPEKFKAIDFKGPFYPVRLSPKLRRRQKALVQLVKKKELGES